jgi:hypothetical protein
MYYIIFWPDGSVNDQYKFNYESEQDFIDFWVERKAVKIMRREDMVTVYEDPKASGNLGT